MPRRLLIVDRDKRYGEWLRHHLGVLCPDSMVSVLDLAEFERWRDELDGLECDVLLLAAAFGTSPEDPAAPGLDILRSLRGRPNCPGIIAIAEEGNELTAVRALQVGALDYLPKRLLTPERLATSVKLVLRQVEKRAARKAAQQKPPTTVADQKQPDVPEQPAVVADVADAKNADVPVPKQADSREPQPVPVSVAEPKPALPDMEYRLALEESEAASQVGFFPYGAEAAVVPPELAASAESAIVAVPTVSESEESLPATAAAQSASEARSGDGAQPGDAQPGDAQPDEAQADEAQSDAAEDGDPLDLVVMRADFLPGYAMHAKVGESEKAAVYVATSAKLGHQVAVKISKTLRDEAAGRQFLEREYTAIVAIRNPYVVQIYDYGVHGGYEYLVMEYLPRGDLKARMQQGLTEHTALEYLEQIATGLRVVHHAGLLHRDLKPPNVMLRENGNVALIDFGLARALDGSTPSTRVGVLRGSPYYMSPEQALGERLDARSDFYSLGIMFYEMLTGRKPYTGASAMDVLQQHVHAPVPQLPKALAHHQPLLGRLLAKSRHERFSSASEIIAAALTAREISQVEPSAA